MDPVYKLLHEMKKRPGMYFGEKHFERLYFFIQGYKYRIMEDSTNPLSHQRNSLDEIYEIVNSHYNAPGNRGWQEVILQNTNSQEEAFDKFFELFDIFLDQKGISPDM